MARANSPLDDDYVSYSDPWEGEELDEEAQPAVPRPPRQGKRKPTRYADYTGDEATERPTAPPSPPPQQPQQPQQPQGNNWTAPQDGNWEKWFRTVVLKGSNTLSPAQLAAMKSDLAKVGIIVVDEDEIILPNGQRVDIIRGADAGGTAFQWLTGTGRPAAAPTPATPGANPQAAEFWKVLTELIQQNPADASINDPQLRGQADAYRTARELARREQQAGMAEYYGAQGLGESGALAADVASGYDKAGRDIATYNAQLVADELKARRAQVMEALQLYGNMLTADQARAMQRYLAELDAAIRREQLAYNYDALESQLDLDAIRILLGA